jgi:hypothetical protein
MGRLEMLTGKDRPRNGACVTLTLEQVKRVDEERRRKREEAERAAEEEGMVLRPKWSGKVEARRKGWEKVQGARLQRGLG